MPYLALYLPAGLFCRGGVQWLCCAPSAGTTRPQSTMIFAEQAQVFLFGKSQAET